VQSLPWVMELALPLAAIPAGATAIRAVRCDTPKDGVRRCGAWEAACVAGEIWS